jgi:prefoldin subunit 5
MNINDLSKTEPNPSDELPGKELPEQPGREQETQPMDIEEVVETHSSIEMPDASEPVPDPLGEKPAEDQAVDQDVGQPEEPPASEERSIPEEIETPVATSAANSRQATSEEKRITRSTALWLAAGSILLSLMLAVMFSLGLLAIVNGGLTFARPAQVDNISSQLNGFNAQIVSIQSDVEGLRERINTLEGLGKRITVVEQDAELIRVDINAVTTTLTSLDNQVNELDGQVVAMESQIGELDTRTTRFQRFLDGLRDLLVGMSKP